MTLEIMPAEAVTERATDPRLEAPQPAPAAAPEAPAPEPEVLAEVAPEGEIKPEVEAPAKPKRTAEDVLKGRVGHLTKTLSAKDQALVDMQARAEAAEALLAASANRQAPEGQEVPPPPAPQPQTPRQGERTYTQAEFEAQVATKAAADEFNRQADAMYDAGAKDFPDWKDAVDTLVAAGLMNKDLLDAALVSDNGAAVIHYLGTDLEEAERIAGLSPIHKAAALTKIGATLSVPKSAPISAAPAPITPLSGSAAPVVDLEKASGDMKTYAAERAKQGVSWAQGRKRA